MRFLSRWQTLMVSVRHALTRELPQVDLLRRKQACLKEWVATNPAASQGCYTLQALEGDPRPQDVEGKHDWMSFLAARGWKYTSSPSRSPPLDFDPTLILLSQTLTYPLTLAWFVSTVFPRKEEVTITILGARVEASLSDEQWREMMVLCPWVKRWDLHLIGLDVPMAPGEERRTSAVGCEATGAELMVTSERGLFPNFGKEGSDASTGAAGGGGDGGDSDRGSLNGTGSLAAGNDAYVMFNPGLGHWALQDGWKPALAAVASHGKPTLVTSHSSRDQASDLRALQPYSCNSNTGSSKSGLFHLCAPRVNPFRSLKFAVDPVEVNHITSCNDRCLIADFGAVQQWNPGVER